VDDGSTDNTEEEIKSIPPPGNLTYYKKVNGERGAARNFGTKKAKGKYIFFLDSDDLITPNHLEVAKSFLVENNFPELYHQRFSVFDSKIENLISKSPRLSGNLRQKILKENLFGCLLFLRRDIAETHPFDERRAIASSEDYLLNIQLASKYIIHYQNIYTIKMREHEERSSNDFHLALWVNRKSLMLQSLIKDESFINYFGYEGIQTLKSSSNYFVAMKAIMAQENIQALNYLYKSIMISPQMIFDKRILIFFYHLIKKLFKS